MKKMDEDDMIMLYPILCTIYMFRTIHMWYEGVGAFLTTFIQRKLNLNMDNIFICIVYSIISTILSNPFKFMQDYFISYLKEDGKDSKKKEKKMKKKKKMKMKNKRKNKRKEKEKPSTTFFDELSSYFKSDIGLFGEYGIIQFIKGSPNVVNFAARELIIWILNMIVGMRLSDQRKVQMSMFICCHCVHVQEGEIVFIIYFYVLLETIRLGYSLLVNDDIFLSHDFKASLSMSSD